jgi:hypothetical protein
MSPPQFEEIAGFLNRFAPERVTALAERFPNQADLLRVGARLGDEGGMDPLLFRLEAAQEATAALREAVRVALPSLRARLRGAKRLKLFLEVATVLSGSITAAAALPTGLPFSPLLPSMVTAATALATAARSSLLETFGDPASSADGLYRQLLEASAEAELLSSELDIAVRTKNQEKRGTELIEEANSLLKNSRRLLGLAGL